MRWNNRTSNLHRVWDSSIAEQLRGGNSYAHATQWAADLHADITTGRWKSQDWGACMGDVATRAECPLLWAQDTNRLMCSYVLPLNYPDGFAGSELAGAYYDGATGIVEEQVAMAGLRMGLWLNAMFAGGGGEDDSEL